jgi:hypothetical protein
MTTTTPQLATCGCAETRHETESGEKITLPFNPGHSCEHVRRRNVHVPVCDLLALAVATLAGGRIDPDKYNQAFSREMELRCHGL